ncbi:MAG: hypothetical protein WCL32_25015 [Planctomycetota bacterium]
MQLLARCVCPHCWAEFAPENAAWVAAHAELLGDVRLGPDQPLRFLPSRFDIQGRAIDARGFVCHQLACPRCHLVVPRGLLEIPTYFVSILGTPGCGKSVFLSAMTWELRRQLPKLCGLTFQDVDPDANRILNDYEHQMFFSKATGRPVPMHDLIRKTEKAGDQYDFVSDGDQIIQYPRPFLFSLRKEANSPKNGSPADRILCLYDNAGEHFLAGQDSVSTPVTQHLVHSDLLMFLFDPLQHPRFAKLVNGGADANGFYNRQELVLVEAASRIRKLKNLSQNQAIDKPLIVILTKSDVWNTVLKSVPIDLWETAKGDAKKFLQIVEEISGQLRKILVSTCPEVVGAAESLAKTVVYVPISALGMTPTVDPQTSKPSIDPAKIASRWVTVPLAYALVRYPWNASKFYPDAKVLK